jgi:hypothetical protein
MMYDFELMLRLGSRVQFRVARVFRDFLESTTYLPAPTPPQLSDSCGLISKSIRAMSGARHWEQDKEATVYIGNLDERVTDALVWELMLQAGRIVSLFFSC